MKPAESDDLPVPERSRASLPGRVSRWIDDITRSAYEDDQPLIESEGLVLVERHAPGRVTLSRFGAWRMYWDNLMVVVTRERFRIYTGRFQTLVDISLTDPDELRTVDIALDRSGRLRLFVPRRVGRGPSPRARANRRIRIKTPRAREILDLIRDA